MKIKQYLLSLGILFLLPSGAAATLTNYSLIDITTATGASATQSSDFSATIYTANDALNGSTGDFSHTAGGDNAPSWTADFGRVETFNQVLLYNRGDGCCQGRFSDLTVSVLDAGGASLYVSPLLNPGNILGGPALITLDLPAAVTGQKLVVSRDSTGIGGGDEVLSLGEVRIASYQDVVLPLGTNLTQAGIFGMSVAQSPTSASPPGGGFANNAVDGNFGNFSHTDANLTVDATFQVDFGEEVLLESVLMFNRGDGCCPERLRDITVTVLDENGASVFTSALLNPANALGGPGQINVDLAALNGGSPIAGRTVVISRAVDNVNVGGTNDDRSVLSLGELQIFGGSLVGTDEPFAITSIAYDGDNDSATVTWPIRLGTTYAIDASYDLAVWEELADNNSTGSFTENSIAAPEGRRFYRVREE